MPQTVTFASWNVNGIRAAYSKGLMRKLPQLKADVVALQEVRCSAADLPEPIRRSRTWRSHFVEAKRKGYSGVGLLSKLPLGEVRSELGDTEMDAEGRLQMTEMGELILVNGYFPNGNGKERDNSRVPFKLDFYRRVWELLQPELQAGRPILVCGDLNTAHRDIDLARPKQNRKTSGFLLEECEEFQRWLDSGWVDTFRRFQPEGGHYTWWSQRAGVRAKNIGWRIDYFLASPGAVPFLEAARIHPQVTGSDHCPISVTLRREVLGALGTS